MKKFLYPISLLIVVFIVCIPIIAYAAAAILDAPKNLHWEGFVAEWDDVVNATNYDVALYDANGSKMIGITTSVSKYDFSARYSNTIKDGFYFTVVPTAKNFLNGSQVTSSKYKEPQIISLVEFQNYTFPVDGQEYNHKDVKLKSGFPGKIESSNFYMGSKTYGGKASKGDEVTLSITVQLDDGYVFSAKPSATLGGRTPDMVVHNDSMGDSLYRFNFDYVVPRDSSKPLELYTIKVDFDDSSVEGCKLYLKTDKGTNDFQTTGYSMSATEGTTVEIKAASTPRFKFSCWATGFGRGEKIISTEPNYSFVAESNMNIRAVFTEEKYVVNQEVAPIETTTNTPYTLKEFTITVSYDDENMKGGKISLKTNSGTKGYQSEGYSMKATEYTSVTVEASEDPGYEFVQWMNGTAIASTNSMYMFNARQDETIRAVFKKVETPEYVATNTEYAPVEANTPTPYTLKEFTITVAYDDENMKGGKISLKTDSGTKGYQSEGYSMKATEYTSVTVEASEDPGYEFVQWMNGTAIASTNSMYMFNARQDETLRAVYKKYEAPEYVEYKQDEVYVDISTLEPIEKVWANASSWAEEELGKAQEKGVIPEIFKTQDLTKNITRKEFTHVAVKLYEILSGNKAIATINNPFKDTQDSEVLKAYDLGITKGTGEDTFSPDALITREQMATMLKRALEKAGINTEVDLEKVSKFADDSDLHDWGKEAVYYMSNLGIIKGIGNNKFGVAGDATREQSLLISVRSADKFAK